MASIPDSRYTDAGPGGGSAWENPHDASSLKPFYNDATGQWEWRYPDGTTTQNSYVRDAVKGTERDIYNTPNPGGGGGQVPNAVKKLATGLVPAIPAIIGRELANNNAPGGGPPGMSPELQQMLALAMRRMTEQEPLFRSINAQAMGGLPTAYQKG